MYFVPFDISFSFLLPFCFGEQSAIFIVQTWLWEEESSAKPPGSRIFFFFYKILCHWMSGVFQCSYNKIRHIAPLRANRSPMCCCRGYRQHSHADVWEFASFVFSSTYHYQSPRTVRLLELWVIPQSSYLLTPADFFELCKERSEEKGGGGRVCELCETSPSLVAQFFGKMYKQTFNFPFGFLRCTKHPPPSHDAPLPLQSAMCWLVQ